MPPNAKSAILNLPLQVSNVFELERFWRHKTTNPASNPPLLKTQALHVATDSNVDLACRLAALPGAVDQLSALVRGADVAHVKISMAMRVQAAGVLVNVAGLSSNAAQTAEGQAHLSSLILPLLLERMSYDPAALQQACVALAASTAAAASNPEADPDSMDVDPDGGAAVGGEGGTSKGQGAVEARVAAGVAAAMPMDMATSGAVSVERPPQEAAGGVASKLTGKAQPGAEDGRREDVESCTTDAQVAAPDQPDMDAQLRWGWKMGVAEPLKLTAEVMANLCSLGAGETGEREEDEEEWGSDDEDAMEQVASGQQQQDSKAGGGSAPAVLLDAMAEGRALPRTLATLQALLSPTPRDQDQAAAGAAGGGAGVTPPLATEGVSETNRLPLPGGTASDLADLRATVALCAANLVQNLPERALGESPYGLWTDLCGLCEAAVERAPSCVETLTGVMWGLARRAGPAVAAGIKASSAAPVAAGGAAGFVTDPLHMILRLCDPAVTKAFEARVNAVGMLGALGSAAAGAGSAPSAAQGDGPELRLGRALVQVMEDPHVLVQAEALNAVMDVYGDDDLDAAFRASGAPEALASAVPAFRRKVKQEGKVLGRDALCHLKETALNASRFVKYKQGARGRGR